MVSPGILNPVTSPLTAAVSGEGGAGASPAGISELTVQPQNNVNVGGWNEACKMFTWLVTARNICLNQVMSKMEVTNAVNDSLADWDLTKGLTHAPDNQPSSPPSITLPGKSSTAKQSTTEVGSTVLTLSEAVIQPGRSFDALLASGEYAAPDLVQHVHNLQYAPLPMFAVKEMHERRLSNIAYPTKIEVDIITSKKKTVINTDDFATMEQSITHDEFIECYKGFTHVHQEVFPAERCLFLHEFFKCPGLFSVISCFDAYMRLTWIQPHGHFAMDSDDTFRVLEQFDWEVHEEHEADTWRMHMGGSQRCSASPGLRFHTGNERAPSSARCILCAKAGHLAPTCTVRSSKCTFKNGALTSKADNHCVCFLFNTAKGCIKGHEHNHVCSICLASTHSAQKCSVAL
ncbi:hypothetical protein BS47DRAFT_1355341 [Hydnum rufescens UP504]|uniref:Uncharacterized protein n=1 Tax=Hydnum rufescens UP504 TaxID=1448309 RepID=A0A9P6AFM5_9AGAM|nr:hypothetical protein BS47DRAFT_1355341 [Hydnum rufescens UP504]